MKEKVVYWLTGSQTLYGDDVLAHVAQHSREMADYVNKYVPVTVKYLTTCKSSDENNYSVCMLLTQGSRSFLFTGDLEKEGEESLVALNSLPHCALFKGGHHGSRTSSNDILLRKITPENVCICCCAGAPEYSKDPAAIFPTQEMIDRVAKYTKNIYVTSLATGVAYDPKAAWDFTSMNGNITVTSSESALTVTGSNNSTILRDTDWFKANRTWPSNGVM